MEDKVQLGFSTVGPGGNLFLQAFNQLLNTMCSPEGGETLERVFQSSCGGSKSGSIQSHVE